MNARHLFVFDDRVQDIDVLIGALPAGSDWAVFDPAGDGVERLRATMAGRQGLESIQLITHGSAGAIEFGSGSLRVPDLEARREALAEIGGHLAPGGDILLYGCEVARGEDGERFVQALARLTGANIAASSGPVGSAERGGDWVLDRHVGHVGTASIAPAMYGGLLVTYTGDAGDNSLVGSAGDDVLVGGAGNDTLDGAAGNDIADYSTSTAGVTVLLGGTSVGLADDGMGGSDSLISIEGARGSAFADWLVGSDLETLETFVGGAGDDVIDGGLGPDLVDYSAAPGGVTVNLAFQSANDGTGGVDSLTSIEQVLGSAFDDSLTGDGADNSLVGGAGTDVLSGAGGNDTLVGAGGNDVLDGGAGDDLLVVSKGDNHLSGAAGNDIFQFSVLSHTVNTIGDFTGGDRVVLSDLAAISSLAAGTGQTTAGGAVEYSVSGNQATLWIGLDATPGADASIVLNGFTGVSGLQFIGKTLFASLEAGLVVSSPLANVSINAGIVLDAFIPYPTFSDPYGSALALSATLDDGSALPAWLSFNPSTRSFHGTPSAADAGVLDVRVVASDGLRSVGDTFTLTVNNLGAEHLGGQVQDGYIEGAHIYIDANGNQLPDAGEDTGLVTDSQGRFFGDVYASGALIAIGGTDLDTGLPSNVILRAPAGAGVITSVTTLIQSLIETQGMSLSAAHDAVEVAFGLPLTVNLLQYDPLAHGATDPTGLAVQKVSAQLAIAATLAGDTAGVMAGIAQLVVAGTPLNLADPMTLGQALASLPITSQLQDSIVQANAAVAASTTTDQVAAAQQAVLPHFRGWNPMLDHASELVDALLAPSSGLVVDLSTVHLQYGVFTDTANGTGQSSLGFFGGGVPGVNLGSGLILSSGDATPPEHNTDISFSTVLTAPDGAVLLGDEDLQQAVLLGFPNAGSVQDVTTLEFSFTISDSAATGVRFELVFGSDEFPEWSNSSYVDIAGVFINGVNYALFGGNVTQPLSVTDANLATGAFIDNQDGHIPLEYDGISLKLTIIAPVHEGTNTIKIAVGDTGDQIYDSSILVSNLQAVNYDSGGLKQEIDGTSGNDTLTGTADDDFIQALGGDDIANGGEGDDVIDGGSGNDTLAGGMGNDQLYGGTGRDTAVFLGRRVDYSLVLVGATVQVTVVNGDVPDGDLGEVDVLSGIELIRFADQTIAAIAPSLSITAQDASLLEGNSGGTWFTFDVTRTGETGATSSAFWSVSGGTANGADFVGGVLPSGTVSFAAGETTHTVMVQVAGDTGVEPNETFTVTLSAPVGATIATASATSTIVNDDSAAGSSLLGTPGADTINGTSGSDSISGLAGDDLVSGLAGNDTIDGGSGLDVAVYAGLRANYVVTPTGVHAFTVADLGGAEGVDSIANVERLLFSDGALGLDVDGIGGQAYRLYQAAFDRTPDEGGLGFWIYYLDRGFDFNAASNNFLNSAEFTAMYGANPTNEQYVTLLYTHVMHRAPDAGGNQFWIDAMANKDGAYGHAWTKGEVLALFSDSAENKANVIGQIQDGFEYQPFHP